MAEMRSKYPGTCKVCRRNFPEGTRILWAAGQGARHVPAECGEPLPEGVEDAPQFRELTSKFGGRCKNCRELIIVGERIKYAKGVGAFHATCPTEITGRPAPAIPAPTQVFGGGTEPAVPEPFVPNGRYTVALDGPDDRVYLRLSKGFEDKPGTQKVSWQRYEGDNAPYDAFNSSWVAFGTMNGKALRVWSKMNENVPARVLLALESLMVPDSWVEYGEAYAVEFGKCYRCGATLKVPASLCRGLGPECAKVLGVSVSKARVQEWLEQNALVFEEITPEEEADRDLEVRRYLAGAQ